MKKAIQRALLFIAILSLFLMFVSSLLLYYNYHTKTHEQRLRDILWALPEEPTPDEQIAVYKDYLTRRPDVRITYINEDGTVLFDSDKDASTLPNHKDRPEVQEAFRFGESRIRRFSDTISSESYYLARRLDPQHILRVAMDRSSLISAFVRILPYFLILAALLVLIALYLSSRLTKRILEPLLETEVDFSSDKLQDYQELSPFLHTIKRQEDQLYEQFKQEQRKAKRIDFIFEHMKEGMVLIDNDCALLSINPAAAEFFRVEGDFFGRDIITLTRNAELIQKIRSAVEAMNDGNADGSFDSINVRLHPNEQRTYRVFLSPLIDETENRALLLLIEDVTLEVESQQMREEFTGNVAHELSTPLTSISGFAELLAQGDDFNEAQRMEFVSAIQKEAGRLRNLINDLKHLSFIEESSNLVFNTVDCVKLAKRCVDDLLWKAEEANVELILDVADAPEPNWYKIEAHDNLLEEAIRNLLDNSIKYNREHGTVRLCLTADEYDVTFTIEDTGVGIPEDALPRIFERFYRVDQGRSRRTGGTGLGLSLVKHIIKQHNGQIRVLSKLQQGTTFTITLPKVQD